MGGRCRDWDNFHHALELLLKTNFHQQFAAARKLPPGEPPLATPLHEKQYQYRIVDSHLA